MWNVYQGAMHGPAPRLIDHHSNPAQPWVTQGESVVWISVQFPVIFTDVSGIETGETTIKDEL